MFSQLRARILDSRNLGRVSTHRRLWPATARSSDWAVIRSPAEYEAYQRSLATRVAFHRTLERDWITGKEESLQGFCEACRMPSKFTIDYRYAYEVGGVLTPNLIGASNLFACDVG